MRRQAACTASASRSPMHCPSAWKSRSRASRRSTGWFSSAASRRASSRSGRGQTGAAPRCGSGPTRRSSERKARFKPERVFKMTRSKAYLFGGVEIRWSCAKELLRGIADVPEEATFHFADGLKHICRLQSMKRRLHIRKYSAAAPARSARMAPCNGRWHGLPMPTNFLLLLQYDSHAGRWHA